MNFTKRTQQFYFDHNATTPVCDEVLAGIPEFLKVWGNPSSIHWAGRGPKNLLRDARKAVAESIGSSILEVVFTSGGSEGNNAILKGVFDSLQTNTYLKPEFSRRRHFMCSAVEHPSVIKTMLHLQSLGARVDFIPVTRQGEIDFEFYLAHLSEDTALVSVMAANNETGTLFPIQKLAEKAHQVGALFHTDAVQAYGKIPVNVKEWGVDFATFSGHKVYSLKGSGFIYVGKGLQWTPLIHGGGQERHRRGGTENILGIAALGLAAQRLHEVSKKSLFLKSLRDHMEARILKEIPSSSLTAGEQPRLPNTSSLILTGCDGETMLMSLDLKGFAVSTGAACSSGNPEPSPVLLAMGLSRGEAQNSLRVSLGWDTNLDDVNAFVDTLKEVVQRIRSLSVEEETLHV